MEGSGQCQSCLPEWCTFVCTCADSTLVDICDRLQNGTVTLKELEKISAKKNQMDKLCSSHIPQKDPEYAAKVIALKQILNQRIKERKHFTKTKDLLGFLCKRVQRKICVIGKFKADICFKLASSKM